MATVKTFWNQWIIEAAGPGATPGPSSIFAMKLARLQKLWRHIVYLYERRCQRQALLELDERMLKDIGVSAADAWREGQLPFWKDSDWRVGS